MLQIIHHLITFFVVFGGIISGFILKNLYLLTAHMFFCGNIVIHWLTNDNRCILSKKDDYAEKNGYTAEVLKYVGIHIDPTNESIGNVFSYGITLTSLIISWRRLLSLTKNKTGTLSEPDSAPSAASDSAEPSQPQSP
jgi:hypothetical protein